MIYLMEKNQTLKQKNMEEKRELLKYFLQKAFEKKTRVVFFSNF